MSESIYEFIKRGIEKNGGVFDTTPCHLNMLGIRGYWRGAKVDNSFDAYNDTICVAWLDALGVPQAAVFDASCDPGKLDPQFTNAKGIAHLIEGNWKFKRGFHFGVRALNQAMPFSVRRFMDLDKNPKPVIDTGFFGINVHAGGTSPHVGNYSAGCQVIFGGWTGEGWKRMDHILFVESDPAQVEIHYTLTNNSWIT
jgi:hypothetical protein